MQPNQQFLEMLLATIKGYLNEKYPKKELPDIISSHLNFASEYRQAVDENKSKPTEKSKYIPKGKSEKEFHDKLLKSLAEKKHSR